VSWKLPGPPERVLDVSLSALGRDGGERIAFFRDVTDEQTEIATRSRFLATAAHELRTPLGSICGFTELMLVRNYTREQARPMLETVLRQAMRLSALLNDLLDLSQMDTVGAHAFPLGPVDLGEVMQSAVQVVLVPGGGREIRVTAPAAATWVTGHGAKLEQVLINLLSNALKYSPDGGPVTLAALTTTDGVAVAVTDQGLGLTEEQQAKLFTRFFRADPSGPIPGTGLGLVIVKELVERMGGRVEVRSRPGEGSTFTLHLRRAGAPTAAGPATSSP
jgi:signal transduction histidine kinase